MTRLSLILILVSFVSCTLNPKDKQIKYGTQKEKDEYGNRNLQTYFNKEDFKNEQAYILYSKAIKESQDRDFKSAISYMKNALTFDATNKMILNDLGALYSENNMIDSAKFYTRLSLKLDSTNINALNNLGLY
jgi:Flp pilus assembly protein TadD